MTMNNHVQILRFNSPEEAPDYPGSEYKVTAIDYVAIVHKGTVEGRSTVDIVFIDDEGQKYVTMITGRLLKTIAGFVET